MATFVYQLLLNIILLGGIFMLAFAGARIFRPQFSNSRVGFFVLVVCVVTSVTVLSAIYHSLFKTILLGVPVLSLLYWFLRPKRSQGEEPLAVKVFYEWAVVHIVMFSLFSFVSMIEPSQYVNIPSRDFTYYARASHQLIHSGVETHTYSLLEGSANKPEPYHYFDLWLAGSVAKLFNNNNLFTLYYLIYPLGFSVAWLGLCGALSLGGEISRATKVLAFFATAVAGNFLPYTALFDNFMNNVSTWQFLADTPPDYLLTNLWYYPKLFPVYWAALLILIFIQEKKFLPASFVACGLCFAYTTVAPTMLFGLCVFLLAQRFYKQEKKYTGSSILLCAVTALFVLFFYWVPNGSPSIHYSDTQESLLTMFKRGIRYIFDSSLQILNLYSLWLIGLATVLVFVWRKGLDWRYYRSIVLFAGVIAVSGAFIWGFFRSVQDADQLYSNISLTILNVVIAFLFVSGISYLRGSKSAYALIFLFLSLCGISLMPHLKYPSNFIPQRLYGDDFLEKVEDISPTLSTISPFFFDKEDYKTNVHADVEILGQYLALFRSDQKPISLSIFSMPKLEEYKFLPTGISQHPFYQFVLSQREVNPSMPIEDCQCEFIKTFNINHVITRNRNNLPPCLHIAEEIKDRFSQQSVCLITLKGPQKEYSR